MTYLATNFAELRSRLSLFSQRRLKARAEGASSHQEGFFSQRLSFGLFSEELLLSASVLFLPILYMTAALALLSGVGLGRWVFPTGLLLWGAAVVMLHRKERWQRLLTTLLLFLAVFVLVVWATRFTLDSGWDSRAYHAKAILFLLEGVNPYQYPAHWETYSYPAAHWLLSASFILWTQSFEASFAFTPIAALAAFLCARRFLATLPHLPLFWRNVLAFLLVANPIVTWSFFSHHNDGLLASTLLSVFLAMLCFVSEDRVQGRTTRRRTALYVAALLVLLINIKFTGLVYGGILGLTALAYGVRRGASRRTLLRLAGLGSGAAILGVALFGFFPYVTNVAIHKNPFYPAVQFDEEGNRNDVLISSLTGKEFYDKSSYEKWWISLFSKAGRNDWHPVSLPPFSSLHPSSFLLTFGPLFSGSWLLCLSLVFFVQYRGAWIVLAGVMASVLFTSVSFHFRLTPQNWWLPIFLLVFLLASYEKPSLLSRAQRAVVFVVVACLSYVSFQSLKFYGSPAIEVSRIVRQAEKQGGWFVVASGMPLGLHDEYFVNYYKSGLSGVRLPVLSECPKKAEQRRLFFRLVLCRP